jgi:hypothetical protein
MYVLQDQTLYGNSARPVPVNGNASANTNPGQEEIKRHLEGHGRKRRGIWTEMSLFVVDRKFPDATAIEMTTVSSNTTDDDIVHD